MNANGKTAKYRNFDVTTDERGVVSVVIDVPDRPLNVLTHHAMMELEQIVTKLEDSSDAKLVVFRSGKESGFLAGADVATIAEIQSPVEAMQLLVAGQSLFERIERLPIKTLVLIDGPCLGGGLEWSLACDYRIARDSSSTKIGLPEIRLGLIPGWGGTQRLPRVVGFQKALTLVLTGKHLSGRDAHRIGLVDRVIPPSRWTLGVDEVIADLLDGMSLGEKKQVGVLERMLNETSLGRLALLQLTRRKIASKTRAYPALSAAVRAIGKGVHGTPGHTSGYQAERDEFVALLSTPTCRHLLGLFFAREKARTLTTWCGSAGRVLHDRPIRHVGVVGAGAMGAGIGHLAAIRGYDVFMKEADERAAYQGQERVNGLVHDYTKRKKLNDDQSQELKNRIRISHHAEALADCDIVVEAIVEREDIKRDVFMTLDQSVKPDGLLVTNTSSLSVTRIAEATTREDRVAGLHFFNPVHRMELVEVVRGQVTDERTIAKLVSFVKALGKTPIVTSDSPGFLVNRVLFPYLGEAITMASEGIPADEIDRDLKHFGMPMGPLELLDQVGLDVAKHVAGSLKNVLPGVSAVTGQLNAMVDADRLGKKSNHGFYRYVGDKRKRGDRLPIQNFLSPKRVTEHEFVQDGLSMIQRRLVYPMLTEAIRCHEEQVVTQPWAIDLAMVLGTGYAPHRGGPLHTVDTLGLPTLIHNLRLMQRTWGERFAAPDELLEMLHEERTFFGTDGRVLLPSTGEVR